MAYKFDDKIRSSLREDRDTPSHNGVPETLVCVERSRAKDQGPEVRGLAQRGILRSDTYRIHALTGARAARLYFNDCKEALPFAVILLPHAKGGILRGRGAPSRPPSRAPAPPS